MKEQNEIFKDIQGYEDYQVSNLGRVKSLKFGKERILKPGISNAGYYHVQLCKNKKIKLFRVHQLVMITFLEHNPNGHRIVCDHINGNRFDNRLENLQLITQRQNIVKSRLINENLSSQYTGVCWFNHAKKWEVNININKTPIYLGRFEDELFASQIYQKALEMMDLFDGNNKRFRELVKASI